MAVSVSEGIRGVAVCLNNTRRNQLEAAAATWTRRQGFDAPTTERVSDKYGPGPNLVIACDFPTKADADTAWATLANFDPTFILDGSWVQQYTDLNDGTPATIHHRFEWRNGQRITVV